MRVQAIFNRDGGTFRTTDMEAYARHAEKVFAEAGHHLDCDIVEGADIEMALRRCSDRTDLDAMLAGGGDGTVSAAAGIACLTILAETDAVQKAADTGAALRAGLNDVLAEFGLKWSVYGTSSGFHLFVNPKNRDITPHGFDPYACEMEELKAQPQKLNNRMRIALLVNGVDTNPRIGGLLSCTHTAQDVADTVAAYREALKMLKAEGELPV